ncbi:beta-fructofuranosidase-like protein [Angomonas deanei]|uniref:Uncharacterized protein n=1 Tax=Angomonas deanei TaxID=59799 RepID=A0A7G2C6D6_9TRYP|nr:beta-fructofuranosidase-like protein [Angomonas deanei]CAD2214621.1 hypothetical protein, conserved [Angomonas deanei]|eukprot:EPY22409.1 beta-fructofuranosidase-like protein [Angomonas deanei]
MGFDYRKLSVTAVVLCMMGVESRTFDLIANVGLDQSFGFPGAYGECTSIQSGANGYGRKGCETPSITTALLMNDAVNHDYLFILGGWQRKECTLQDSNIAFSYLSSMFATVTTTRSFPLPNVLPALGAADSVPDGYFDPSATTQSVLQGEVGYLQNMVLTGDEASRMGTCGYYSRQPTTDLRMIVLYTLVWSTTVQPPAGLRRPVRTARLAADGARRRPCLRSAGDHHRSPPAHRQRLRRDRCHPED